MWGGKAGLRGPAGGGRASGDERAGGTKYRLGSKVGSSVWMALWTDAAGAEGETAGRPDICMYLSSNRVISSGSHCVRMQITHMLFPSECRTC